MNDAVRQPTLWKHDDMYDRFVRFHGRHPEVYVRLVRLCRQWRARGRDQWSSMGAIYVLRFDHRLHIEDPDEAFKISNGYAPWYSRLVMGLLPEVGPGEAEFRVCCERPEFDHPHIRHPYHPGIFELRELKRA